MVAEHQKRFNSPPDFFTAGGMAAALAIHKALETAKTLDSEGLIAAMEGMSWETPKGTMDLPQGGSSGAAVDVSLQDQGR